MIITDSELLHQIIEILQAEIEEQDVRYRIYIEFFKIFTPMEELLGEDPAYDEAYSKEFEF